MLFVLGILGLLQVTTLPGAIALKLLGARMSVLQRVVYTFAISLLINYCAVFLLVLARIYIQPVLLLVVLAEILGCLWLYRVELRTPLIQTLGAGWQASSALMRSFFPEQTENNPAAWSMGRLLPVLTLGLAVYSLTSLWAVLKLFIYNLGTVFGAWDVVVSWNRWASTWAGNAYPLDSHFYPPLIPTTWASIYVVMGNLDIQFFAKAIMPLFPLLLLVLLLDLGFRQRQSGYFIALILAQLLLKKFLAEEMYNGYVDVAVAFFGLLPLHALLLARGERDPRQRDLLLILGAAFAAGAALTKQSGLYIAAFYPLLVAVALRWPENLWKAGLPVKKYILSYVGVMAVPGVWYLFRVVLFWLGRDRAETAGLVQITSAAYEHVGLLQQIISAFGNFDRMLVLFIVVLLALPLLDPLYRAIALVVVFPYPLLWAWGAAYDTRNLALFVPVFALVSGLALQVLLEFSSGLFDRLPLQRVAIFWLAALALLGLLAGRLVVPDSTLLVRQTNLSLLNFSPEINQKIYDIIKQDGPQTLFLTNYPVRYLPGLEHNQIQFSFRDYTKFLEYAKDPAIRYMIIPGPQLDGQVESYVKAQLANGNYRLILSDKNWVKFSLVEVIKR